VAGGRGFGTVWVVVGVAAYKAASLCARRVPEPLGVRSAELIGRLASRRNSPASVVAARNLERALGRPLDPAERRRLVAQAFAFYARYYLESFRLPGTDAATLDSGFAHSGTDPIWANTGPGSDGAILALPHLGTWEWAAHWLAQVADVQVTAVVERLEPPEVFEWFVGLRRSLGMEILPLGPDVGQGVISALKRGRLVCLLCDRDLVGNGVAVEFFGERTTLPAGPATLAMRLGVPLSPAAVYWRDDGRIGRGSAPRDTARRGRLRDDVARVTQAVAHEFERLIRAAPEQWHLLSPNWPSDYVALGRPVPGHLQALTP